MQAYAIVNLSIFLLPVVIYLIIVSYALYKKRNSVIGFFWLVGLMFLLSEIFYGFYYIAYLFYIPVTTQQLYDIGVVYTPLLMSITVVMLFIAILRIPEPRPKEPPIKEEKVSKAKPKSKKRRSRR